MKVQVAVAWPGRQVVVDLVLPAGSTVAEAIAAARPDARLAGLDLAGLRTGIWSRPCARHAELRDGDRVELYRPLAADPKEMRRARARRPGRG